MSDVYLKAWHGGLGDALQFSTLPEEFEKQQGRKTNKEGDEHLMTMDIPIH